MQMWPFVRLINATGMPECFPRFAFPTFQMRPIIKQIGQTNARGVSSLISRRREKQNEKNDRNATTLIGKQFQQTFTLITYEFVTWIIRLTVIANATQRVRGTINFFLPRVNLGDDSLIAGSANRVSSSEILSDLSGILAQVI